MASAISSISTVLQKSLATWGSAAPAPTPHAWVQELLEREGPGILRMLWRLLRNEADVQDAFQDCFCKLALRGGPSDLRSAKAYAYRTASNIAIELLRSGKRMRMHQERIAAMEIQRSNSESGHPEEGPVDADAHTKRLREAIVELPQHLQQVVVLRDLSRMSYEEIGRILGIQPATARVYRRHAVVKLAEMLNGEVTP
jgi:RNA polymerase sigma factor (sigma-70 family)